MKITIYVEGGSRDNRDTKIRCKQGFVQYFKKIAREDRRPKVVVSGSREEAFKKFKTAISSSKTYELCALLVDSEGPVPASTRPEVYLSTSDQWTFPDIQRHRVFLMVQAMEAWFYADPQALAAYYGQGFKAGGLPGAESNIEAIQKGDLIPALRRATIDTRKGPYNKSRHSFALLETVDPAKVAKSSPHANALNTFLRSD